MALVQRVRTIIPGSTSQEVWAQVMGALIQNGVSPRAAPVLLAHILLEHGRNLSAIYNWNVGNIKMWQTSATALLSMPYYVLTDNHLSTDRYRAFPSLAAGLAPYVYEIMKRRPIAYSYAMVGDAVSFSRALFLKDPSTGAGGYIGVGPHQTLEGAISDATRNITGLYRETVKVAPKFVGPGIFLLVAALGAGAYFIWRKRGGGRGGVLDTPPISYA